jgi:hypothetical protein
MTTPRQARALDVLLAEVNTHAPHRSTVSDGGIGDARHRAEVSDHNPNAAGVWRARDVTNDPAGGMPGADLAARVAAKLGTIPALGPGAYVIFNRRIVSTNRITEGWRSYTGTNAHTHHVHVSVATRAAGYDDTTPWDLWGAEEDTMPTPRDLWDEPLKAADDRHAGVALGQTWRMVRELAGEVAALRDQVAALVAELRART